MTARLSVDQGHRVRVAPRGRTTVVARPDLDAARRYRRPGRVRADIVLSGATARMRVDAVQHSARRADYPHGAVADADRIDRRGTEMRPVGGAARLGVEPDQLVVAAIANNPDRAEADGDRPGLVVKAEDTLPAARANPNQ